VSQKQRSRKIRSACPTCGALATRTIYDIGNGSGPELSCVDCEQCWGADGQDLVPLDINAIRAELRANGVEWL
jgi:hypothetical protein